MPGPQRLSYLADENLAMACSALAAFQHAAVAVAATTPIVSTMAEATPAPTPAVMEAMPTHVATSFVSETATKPATQLG